ncbi:MAG: ABC transporter ATP-binding protein [Candidatus Delongbacteria bacterium]|jgi:lipopolysaccharide transport system ATP-binding protein|nr:ABC transporter ATP-binding protein [Candidatus Delongbacteria bacterium]
MSDTVIKIENLSKKYIIGHETGAPYLTFRDLLADSFKKLNPLSRKDKEISSKEEFWALKDINLEIKQGEKIGIIGRNGAGKSTLLKILSRITEPTTGSVKIKGRVASLLEVGTGFHPELTGRENIFLNGAILGMRREEIKRKFDEIVDFSGVEKFLDTPVKRYSSGMYVRLAFAVAAHLEPEILLIDEVLAVGDAEFQKKCLGKMDDVAKQGRTIVFVSHNMGAIRQLCERGVLLEKGEMKFEDEISTMINMYEKNVSTQIEKDISKILRKGDLGQDVLIKQAFALNKKGDITCKYHYNEDMFFEICIVSKEKVYDGLSVGIRFETANDTYIASCLSQDAQRYFSLIPTKYLNVRVSFNEFHLTPGDYYLTFSVRKGKVFYDQVVKALKITILDFSNCDNVVYNQAWGLVKIDSNWDCCD